MKLGDTIYVYEQYGRHAKTLDEHLAKWKEYKIIDENRASWIAQHDQYEHSQIKIDKKTSKSRSNEKIAITRDEIVRQWEDEQWTSQHAWNIADRMRRLDANTLRKVAELIGYEPK
jgi:uncharacterized GH25 family protein